MIIAKINDQYLATKCGQVLSLQYGKIRKLKPHTNRFGYRLVNIYEGESRKQRKVHQLVLEAFVGPREPGQVCRHLNGDTSDNSLENLAWGTMKENADDRAKHGRGWWQQ